MSNVISLTADQELTVFATAEPITVLTSTAGRKFFLVSDEEYEKIQNLLQVDEIEPSLFEFEDSGEGVE